MSGTTAAVPVSCTGTTGATCNLHLAITVTETLKGHRLIGVTARATRRKVRKVVTVGSANVTLTAGQTETVRISLNGTGRHLLAGHRTLKVKLVVSQRVAGGTKTVSTQTLTFHRGHRR